MRNVISLPYLKEYFDYLPVNNQAEDMSLLLAEWKKTRAELENLYHERNQKSTLNGMQKGIILFVHFLFYTNNQSIDPDGKSISLEDLEVKPVNLVERLTFIVSRPTLFHSYRQLCELVTEQEKLYARSQIIKKASKPNG